MEVFFFSQGENPSFSPGIISLELLGGYLHLFYSYGVEIRILVLTFFLLLLPAVAYGQDLTVYVNNKPVDFPDQKPFIDDNNRTLVPVRFVTEALGADVIWDDKTQTVLIKKGDKEISLTINEKKITINGKEKYMDTSPIITDNNRTMVPVRFISESLGELVGWDRKTNSVYIGEGAEKFIGSEVTDKTLGKWKIFYPFLNKRGYYSLDEIAYGNGVFVLIANWSPDLGSNGIKYILHLMECHGILP